MSLVIMAWKGITTKPLSYETILLYSGRFSEFNGNIRLSRGRITVSLSSSWKDVSTDIQLGIIQHLLCRLFRIKAQTTEMELYHSFLKNAHKIAPKQEGDPVLEESFARNNDRFFGGTMEKPNLGWSTGSRRLGFYHYGSDTINVSQRLAHDLELLDYVMYHEMLHKHHKFKSGSGRSLYHSTAFKQDEAKFPGAELLERRLSRIGLWD